MAFELNALILIGSASRSASRHGLTLRRFLQV